MLAAMKHSLLLPAIVLGSALAPACLCSKSDVQLVEDRADAADSAPGQTRPRRLPHTLKLPPGVREAEGRGMSASGDR
jgi:hypothetical protein